MESTVQDPPTEEPMSLLDKPTPSRDEVEMAAKALAAAVTRVTSGPGAHLTVRRPTVTPRVLSVTLLSPCQDFLTDYHMIRPAVQGEERPVGLPSAFLPLDGVGTLLRKRSMTLHVAPYRGGSEGLSRLTPLSSPSSSSKWLKGKGSKGSESNRNHSSVPLNDECHVSTLGEERSFIVSVFCKAPLMTHTPKKSSALTEIGLRDGGNGEDSDVIHNGARGLVVRLLDESTAHTLVLHVAASELQRVCALEEPSLLMDMNSLNEDSLNRPPLDSLSKGLRSIFGGDDIQVTLLNST